MTQSPVETIDWTSFLQLVQQLIGGSVKRNIFTGIEMELLLDLQMARVRKSSRPEMLRRYFRAVQAQFASGAPAPVPFSRFIENEMHQRKSGNRTADCIVLPRAS